MSGPSTSTHGPVPNPAGLRLKLDNRLYHNNQNNVQCTCVVKLLNDIALLWKKKQSYGELMIRMRPSLAEASPQNYQWQKFSTLFVEHILDSYHCTSKECNANHDDMLWYVPVAKVTPTPVMGAGQILQVFRRQSKNKPVPGDRGINWEETVCLNVILQQFDYYVTCASCSRKPPQSLTINRKNCQRVFPSPSRRRMDIKGESEEMTYPKIYFAIDDFERAFSDVILTEGECVCVELIARDRFRDKEFVIFLGSIRFDVLQKLYDSRGSGTWNWAQKLVTASHRRHEFVKMRGPHGKGSAEMAVARVASCGFETPMSEHGFDMSASLDTDFNRRMSDTNIFGRLMYKRSAVTPGPSSGPMPIGVRGRRWPSDSQSVNQDADFDVRSVTGAETMSSSVGMGSNWSIKGFGSALSWLRDKKEAPALNAYLTYVTLPWQSIMDGECNISLAQNSSDILLNNPRKPILTFELDILNAQK